MGELINLNPQKTLTDADIPAAIARDTETTAAIAAHATAADPHAIYLTQAEGDARYGGAGGGGSAGIPATITISDIESALHSGFRSRFFLETHYLSTQGNGVFPAQGANGGYSYTKAEIGHPGILGLATGSNSAGFCSALSGMGNSSSGIILDNGNTKYFGIIKIPVLRDSTNDFVVEIGFQSAGTSVGLDAVCFVCDNASPYWQCHTRSNGDLAVFFTDVAVTSAWYELKITVSNGIAIFNINGSDILTTAQKIPLNPRMVGAGVDIRKLAGPSGRDILIDYQSVEQVFAEQLESITVQSRALTDADIPESITRDTEADSKISTAINTHVNAAEPHPGFVTEQALAYGISSLIQQHKVEDDPHPVYLTRQEGDALYGFTKIIRFTLPPSPLPELISIAHGLSFLQITGFNILLATAPGGSLLPPNTTIAGWQYTAFLDGTYIHFLPATSTPQIGGKNVVCTVFTAWP